LPPAANDVERQVGDAILFGVIDVLANRQPQGPSGLEHGVAQGVVPRIGRDLERAARAAVRPVAERVAFHCAKIRLHR